MLLFEITIALLIGGALLSSLARRMGAPYPAFLALAGAALALVPGAPTVALAPDLVLTLFVAPSLLDTAYDASPRDLRANWGPILRGAVITVLVSVGAVAAAARWLEPGMSWAAAVVLGAIVAPPDASAATAVLRALRPPHRVMVILEGESLFNDVTALLIYRTGIDVATGQWGGWREVPLLIVSLLGGAGLGFLLGRLRITAWIQDGPTSVIVQFCHTFLVWIVATWLGLSPVLTLLIFAMTIARRSPSQFAARLRVQSYAVWDVAIYVLNVLAFILAGLQLRPILAGLGALDWREYVAFGAAILGVCIAARMGWVMLYGAAMRVWCRLVRAPRWHPRLVPTVPVGLIVGWCGMRGVVTLATALALPESFPFRDLIQFAAFSVVLGSLVVQGLSLRPLLSALRLPEDDMIAREVALARRAAAEAAITALAELPGEDAASVRADYARRQQPEAVTARQLRYKMMGLGVERETILALRRSGAIGDDAFHVVEEEIDWGEMFLARRAGGPPASIAPDPA